VLYRGCQSMASGGVLRGGSGRLASQVLHQELWKKHGAEEVSLRSSQKASVEGDQRLSNLGCGHRFSERGTKKKLRKSDRRMG